MPYVARAVKDAGMVLADDVADADAAVLVSDISVYAVAADTAAGEDSPVDEASEVLAAERAFAAACAAAKVSGFVLRCADIVGTGMTGFPRELAESVWRGTFFHFPDNDARRSAVHASDVAAAAVLAAGLAGDDRGGVMIYNICGADDPRVHDLAEAFAYRMKNKRISTLSTGGQKWLGRLLYGRRRMRLYTCSRLADGSAFCGATGFAPVAVCDYMRTHQYDENSL